MKILNSKTFGSILLIAGTQIGAGMLALPIATGIAGFWPSFVLFILSFAFMLISLFLLLEVNLWSHKSGANIITLAKEHLGNFGMITATLANTLLLYSVAAAYITGGGQLLADALSAGLMMNISPVIGTWIFIAVFGLIVLFGTKGIDVINRVCMVGLAASFIFLAIFTMPHVAAENLSHYTPSFLWASVPVVVLSFTSHIIVPSLKTYLSADVGKLKTSLLWGSAIPLVFYIVWEFLIIGSIPNTGTEGLQSIAAASHPLAALTTTLGNVFHIPAISVVVGLFSFFALVTSFFGVSLSLFDFFSDGLQIKKDPLGKFMLTFLAYVPPLLFALYYPKGFIVAVGYAGVFVSILFGILPAIMVWKGRYVQKIESTFTTPGGKGVLLLIGVGSVVVIILQIAATNQLLPSL